MGPVSSYGKKKNDFIFKSHVNPFAVEQKILHLFEPIFRVNLLNLPADVVKFSMVSSWP